MVANVRAGGLARRVASATLTAPHQSDTDEYRFSYPPVVQMCTDRPDVNRYAPAVRSAAPLNRRLRGWQAVAVQYGLDLAGADLWRELSQQRPDEAHLRAKAEC